MAYTRQVWTNAPSTASPISAARLNIAEGGIEEASDRLDAIEGNPLVAADVDTTSAAVGQLIAVGPDTASFMLRDTPVSVERSPIFNARVKVDPDAYTYTAGNLVPCTIPTYDGSGVVVHPSVKFFPDGWNGHRYWMAFTPYPGQDDEFENPSIAVSDDGVTWSVPAGVTNPLVPSPAGNAFNSDPHLALGPDGRLYLFFRDSGVPAAANERIRCIATADGVTWTSPVDLLTLTSATESLLSPCVWWDNAARVWVMIGVDLVPAGRALKRRTAAALDGSWTAATTVTLTPSMPTGRAIWHLDAQPVGGQIVALIAENGLSTGAGALYFATSEDQGRTFRRAVDTYGTDTNKYRCAIVPELRHDGIGFDTWIGTINTVSRVATDRRRDVFGEHARNLSGALTRTWPYLVGDTFNRADTTAGVGAADTGQAWTTLNGAPGVIGDQAYASTAVLTRAVLDVGVADVEVSAIIDGVNSGLIVRAADASNFIRWGKIATFGYQWQLVVAGAVTASGTSLVTSTGRHLWAVKCRGDRIQFLLDGQLIEEAVITAGQANTRVGFSTDNTAARVEALTVRAL